MASVSKLTVFHRIISVKAASEYSGYSQQYLRRLMRERKISGQKIGQVWLIQMKSFNAYYFDAMESSDQRWKPKKGSQQIGSS
jgi:hypothetical protein